MAPATEVPRVARVSDAIHRTQPFSLGKGESISVASAGSRQATGAQRRRPALHASDSLKAFAVRRQQLKRGDW
jgi:hypothetical protein